MPALEKPKIDLITKCLEVDIPALLQRELQPLSQGPAPSMVALVEDHQDVPRPASEGSGSASSAVRASGVCEEAAGRVINDEAGVEGDRAVSGARRGGRGGFRGAGGRGSPATRGASASFCRGGGRPGPLAASDSREEGRRSWCVASNVEQAGGVGEVLVGVEHRDTSHCSLRGGSVGADDDATAHKSKRVVVQTFRASAVDELSLEVGQFVLVLELDSSGWIKGRCLASGGWEGGREGGRGGRREGGNERERAGVHVACVRVCLSPAHTACLSNRPSLPCKVSASPSSSSSPSPRLLLHLPLPPPITHSPCPFSDKSSWSIVFYHFLGREGWFPHTYVTNA